MGVAAAALAMLLTHPAAAAPVRTAHLTADLISGESAVQPGSTVWLAAIQRIDPGWHTYWRNPGDAGEATSLAWALPPGWKAGAIVWPAPGRFPLGPIMDYGYAGDVTLAVPVRVPRNAAVGSMAPIAVKMSFLVCAQVCVPGEASLRLDLPVARTAAPAAAGAAAIAAARAAAPKAAPLIARSQLAGGRFAIAVAGPGLFGTDLRDAWFFPYDDRLIAQSAAERLERGPHGLTLTMTAGAELASGDAPAHAQGVLEAGGAAYEIDAVPGPPPAGASGLGPPPARRPESTRAGPGLAAAAALAFVGGLILNLMPCVFPVLAMKAAGLARMSVATGKARAEGLAFAAGVIASFLALAGALIGLRAAGNAVGWGFQLQSPTVVAALALVMLAAALNLAGLFEIGGGLQRLGAIGPRGGIAGAGLTGVLAVVVAAPCTAPFMGPALGWALTQPPLDALVVFLALGLGFAAPFTGLSFSRTALARLPRPGPWMDTFRHAMAFPMLAAAAWLAWVLERQAGSDALARLYAAAIALALAAWLWGMRQNRLAQGSRSLSAPSVGALSAGALAASGLAASIGLVASLAAEPGAPAALAGPVAAGAVAQPYSAARLATLRKAGRPVFVNFTAAWCVTCQVNERLALGAPAVAAAFRRTGAAYLVGDWTRRDPAITAALAEQGRIGVPLYLVYGADGGAPRVLPQLLTPAMVASALEGAAVR